MKVIFKIVFLFFCGSIIAQTNLSLRVNAGGPQLTHNGDVFFADQYFVGGKIYENTSAQVPTLYQTERSADPPTFDYTIPVDNGQYEVTLHFADIYYGATGGGIGGIGKRVFDVTIEGVLVLDNYDIYAEVGGQTVTTKTYTVTVGDSSLDLYFSALTADGGTNQPKLSALEVAGIPSSDTQDPTAPTLSSTGETETTVDLSWVGATDDTAVTGYNIYKDSALETTLGNVGTYQVSGLTASTSYSFTVTALDAAANESGLSNVISVTTDSSSGGSSGGTTLIPVNVTASSDNGNGPENLIDNNLNGFVSRWSADGDPQHATFDLGNEKNFDQVQIAFHYGDQRTNNFDIQVSDNGTDWTYVLTNITSQGNTLDFEDFAFSNQYSRYVRYVGHGNSLNSFNSLSEFRINNVSTADDSSGGSSGGSTVWNESSGNISYTDGNVGIGTSTIPSAYKLAVNGKIITEELKVQLQSAWPDYVFTKGYELPSLEEVERHITENGHLINIPSAKEVEENGLEVGEMNRLLLEKIEELTLYIIQLEKKNKRIDALENEQKLIKQNMKDLKIVIKTHQNEKK